MKTMSLLMITLFVLIACSQDGNNSKNGNSGNNPKPQGGLSEWQTSLIGQEGHGGDAIICFSIPVQQAVYQTDATKDNNQCTSDGLCVTKPDEKHPSNSGEVWRMTDEGRAAIASAKPLEQYLAEKVVGKQRLLQELGQMSLEEGYRKLLQPLSQLPAAFQRVTDKHRQLGWLSETGIASEYGLMDINDSGFLQENEIDSTHCKELQAVVRRDNQLWYDADIFKHFDNVGKILIQLHEEIYAWGKDQDAINENAHGIPAHETSSNTRKLILKLIDEGLDHRIINENLKTLGFSIAYWDQTFNMPTAAGFFMDSKSCEDEQSFLKKYFAEADQQNDFWLKTEMLFSKRYLKARVDVEPELRRNYPDALANMIAVVISGGSSSGSFATDILHLLKIFEQPESCIGKF